jgi:ATP-dependent DNA ligase
MLCYPFEESRFEKWRAPVIVQPKLDGERCRALRHPEGFDQLLLSSELNQFDSVPDITEQTATLMDYLGLPELDGELYVHGWDFSEIHSVASASRKALHPDHGEMEYHIFDVPSDKPQHERSADLNRVRSTIKLLNLPNLKVVAQGLAETMEEVYALYNACLDNNYEGIIVRHVDGLYVRKRSLYVMKFKPKRKDDYEIISFKEAIAKDGTPKGMLGAVECRGLDGTIFQVGGGCLSHPERVAAWRNRREYYGGTVTVQYQNLTSTSGVPRFGLVLELSVRKFESAASGFNPLIS